MGKNVRVSLLLFTILVSASLGQITSAQITGRASGVDLKPTTITFEYTDSANTTNYQMFSSNHPITNFNRPKNMFVVDGMLGVEIRITATIENQGSTASGTFDVTFKILHNEYDGFELFNSTVSGSSISGSSSLQVSTTWVPDYSGNHTMEVIAKPAFVSDDNPSNDMKTRHMTVGYHYDNCLDISSWTAGTQWGTSTDTSTSHGQSCHVGNGEMSTYSNNLATELIMPKIDMSDGLQTPNRISGISFFYSGGAGSGDVLSIHVTEKTGGWTQLATITGVVDNDPLDGSDNWQTFSFSNGGHNSPLIPIDPARHLHANSQFKFRFDSDATGQDIGYFIDEIVVLYDQSARVEEFGWDITGVTGNSGYAGDSDKVSFKITNIGNLTDRFLPSVSGLPSEWTSYFTHTGGGSVNMQNGVELEAGESRWIDLNLMSDANDTAGNYPYQLTITSKTHSSVIDNAATSFQILPDRQPEVRPSETNPICAVGSTCGFSVEVANIGEANDMFDLELSEKNLPEGWSMQLDWNQPSQVFVRAGNSVYVQFSVSVPSDAIPDSAASMWLEATSVNQSSRSDKQVVTVSAGMVSSAEISFESASSAILDPGESTTLTYRLWNNASRQDIFLIEKGLVTGSPTWSVEMAELPTLPVNPGSSITFELTVTAPESAQAGDQGPMIRPKATSQKSGQEIFAEAYSGLSAGSLEDISVTLVSGIDRIIPGSEMSAILNLVNSGNGAAIVTCTSPGLPATWDYWMEEEGYNTSQIELSAPFDLEEESDIEMIFLPPADEAAGEIANITITCSSGENDLTPDDNVVYIEAIVAKSKRMKMTLESVGGGASVGGVIDLNASIANIGNSYDGTIRVKVEIQSSPVMQFSGIIGRADGKGGLAAIDEWLDVPLDQGVELSLMSQITIPDDAPLDSRITITYVLESNRSDDTLDSTSMSALYIIDNRSNVEIEWPKITTETKIPQDRSYDFLLNITSTSTFTETLNITTEQPEDWVVSCGDFNSNDSIELRLVGKSGSKVDEKLLCSVKRTQGEYEGVVKIKVAGPIDTEQSFQLSFERDKEQTESLFSNQNVVYGGIGGGLLIFILLGTLLLRKSDKSEEELIEEKTDVNLANAAQQPMVVATETPQQAHEREMAEYQRKVAEYEAQMAAWNQSQLTEEVKQEQAGPPATIGPPATVDESEEVVESMDVNKAFDVL